MPLCQLPFFDLINTADLPSSPNKWHSSLLSTAFIKDHILRLIIFLRHFPLEVFAAQPWRGTEVACKLEPLEDCRWEGLVIHRVQASFLPKAQRGVLVAERRR